MYFNIKYSFLFLVALLFTALLCLLIYLQLGSTLIAKATQPTTTHLPIVVQEENAVKVAVIGDYGEAGSDEESVANLVKSWQPTFIVTTGDNNYPDGEAATIEANVGQYYGDYVHSDRFFPTLGNHDWKTTDAQPYLDYFPIDTNPANTQSSGTERYYDFIQGSVHFFMVDSDQHEPDGVTLDSQQADWLQAQLAASTTPWQIVVTHHPPYSSGKHGSTERMQWPFAAWGADLVLSGHDHNYERFAVDNIPYIVNGLGGRGIRQFNAPVPNSQVRYNDDFGAMLIQATPAQLVLEFYAVSDSTTPIDQQVVMASWLNELSSTSSTPPSYWSGIKPEEAKNIVAAAYLQPTIVDVGFEQKSGSEVFTITLAEDQIDVLVDAYTGDILGTQVSEQLANK